MKPKKALAAMKRVPVNKTEGAREISLQRIFYIFYSFELLPLSSRHELLLQGSKRARQWALDLLAEDSAY